METIADYPAYRIYKAYEGRKFKHGDKIAIPFKAIRGDTLYRFYRFGSVEGYAIQSGACPHAWLAQHLKFAEELKDGRERYWLGQQAVSIHNGPYTKEEVPGFNFGDTVIFQGHTFRIEPAPNGNAKLVMIDEAE